MVEEGARVVLADVDEESAKKFSNEIEGNSLIQQTDVTKSRLLWRWTARTGRTRVHGHGNQRSLSREDRYGGDLCGSARSFQPTTRTARIANRVFEDHWRSSK